jgi:hypothetical protein
VRTLDVAVGQREQMAQRGQVYDFVVAQRVVTKEFAQRLAPEAQDDVPSPREVDAMTRQDRVDVGPRHLRQRLRREQVLDLHSYSVRMTNAEKPADP